jgi:tRNA/rRNA methyltransferase
MNQTKTGPAIILVRPQMGENIGAAARAMLNCGLTDLRLVEPRDGWPNEAAQANASGALEVVSNATLYKTLAEAVADCRFVIGTTARARDMVKPVLVPETAVQAILQADQVAGKSVSAIVFGPERTGLENDDVTRCDVLVTVPLNPEYASLNIAQAVLLITYQWYRATHVRPDLPDILNLNDVDIAAKKDIETLLAHLTDALDESGFFPTEQQRPNMVHNLYNMFQRMRLTTQETQTFHGMIKALRGKEWKK